MLIQREKAKAILTIMAQVSSGSRGEDHGLLVCRVSDEQLEAGVGQLGSVQWVGEEVPAVCPALCWGQNLSRCILLLRT